MQRINTQRSGFTLIEIIVALIIVGTLAAIAIPNVFRNISKSKGVQALVIMNTYKTEVEVCVARLGNVNPWTTCPPTWASCCDPISTLQLPQYLNGWAFGIESNLAGATAQKGASINMQGTFSAGNLRYTLIAYDIASNYNYTITLTRATNGTWICSTGTASPYTGIC